MISIFISSNYAITMDQTPKKIDVLRLVAENQLEDAFSYLSKTITHPKKKKTLIILEGRFNELKDRIRIGNLSAEEKGIESNNIRISLVELISESPGKQFVETSRKIQPIISGMIVVLLALIVGFLLVQHQGNQELDIVDENILKTISELHGPGLPGVNGHDLIAQLKKDNIPDSISHLSIQSLVYEELVESFQYERYIREIGDYNISIHYKLTKLGVRYLLEKRRNRLSTPRDIFRNFQYYVEDISIQRKNRPS